MARCPAVLRCCALLLSLGNAIVAPVSGQSAAPPAPPSLTRFQSQIDAYLKADSVSPPAAGAIVFVGSSIFRQWRTLAEQMAPLPVYNRAFGGSQTPEVLYYMDQIVLPYRPRIVVYYCGSNDVNAGASASAIVGRIRQFHERLQRELPDTRMFFVSVIRAPQKRSRWPAVDSINAQVRLYAAGAKNIDVVDVNPILLDAEGAVRGALYRSDSLHYKPEAYALFAEVIRPVLQRAWNGR